MTQKIRGFNGDEPRGPLARTIGAFQTFIRWEAAGGVLLVLASIAALIIANSSLAESYNEFFHGVHLAIPFAGDESILHWINDGLMAIFFLLVGLEIKRELVLGELSSKSKAALPVIAAIGGMIVPALIYIAFNHATPETMRGWAIPGATDIAFALAVLSLLGSRIPLGLKVFLTAIAIIDDLGAILIIALFYTSEVNVAALLYALIPLAGLIVLNAFGYARRWAYILLGALLWLAVLKSGIHATMAGVMTGLLIPIKVRGERRSPASRLEHDLHPLVSFLILPLFGFANAGVSFDGIGLSAFAAPVTLGIAAGLFLGKQIGVLGASWLAVKSGLCAPPDGTGWLQIYGASLLCGIGFTMSLFIGGLAFSDVEHQAAVRLGVLAGSLISALAGYIILRSTDGKGPHNENDVSSS